MWHPEKHLPFSRLWNREESGLHRSLYLVLSEAHLSESADEPPYGLENKKTTWTPLQRYSLFMLRTNMNTSYSHSIDYAHSTNAVTTDITWYPSGLYLL